MIQNTAEVVTFLLRKKETNKKKNCWISTENPEPWSEVLDSLTIQFLSSYRPDLIRLVLFYKQKKHGDIIVFKLNVLDKT